MQCNNRKSIDLNDGLSILQALPIERCPQFRDQVPGSSATYNGKCYLFHDNQALNFNEARQFCEARGGSLIDETNPALQGFVSWELWRRHSRNDPSGQYWLGLMRDQNDRSNWKWLSGKDVTVSFWNLPGGQESCARYDGSKGWLWSDTNCNRKLFFICQHRKSPIPFQVQIMCDAIATYDVINK